jgi:uncharacterized protein (DUF362 family)
MPGPGILFREKMRGYLTEAAVDFLQGDQVGLAKGDEAVLDATITVESLEEFMHLSGREAKLTGTFSHPQLGMDLPLREGAFVLFQVDAESGKTHMEYAFLFTAQDGSEYSFFGHKLIHDDPGLDVLRDMTTLFSRIYKGPVEQGIIWGSGVLRFHLRDLPGMLTSMKASGAGGFMESIKTKGRFFWFVFYNLRQTYLTKFSLFYWTGYENLVLRGTLRSTAGEEIRFFMVSGIHPKDFPWGDGGGFWDILLFLEGDRDTRRYALSRWRIPGLELNVRTGRHLYKGHIFEITQGDHVSVREMTTEPLPPHLSRRDIQMDVAFDAQPLGSQTLPFHFQSPFGVVPAEKRAALKSSHEQLSKLGIEIIPHQVEINAGWMTIDGKHWDLVPEKCRGEAEISTWINLRWPTLYYRYFCALPEENKKIRIHIRSDVLRPHRQEPLKDKVEDFLGGMVDTTAWLDLESSDGAVERLSRPEGDAFPEKGETLLEVRNNHFPTATLLRRIVSIPFPQGATSYALHEDMEALDLEARHSDKETAVAVAHDSDKFRALDEVLEKTNFSRVLEDALTDSGKPKEEFAIVIKVNLMFAYSKEDPTTFTDPELVEHLVDCLRRNGYTHVSVADARSTYGVFFTRREVRTVARYFGYRFEEKGYSFHDLSEDPAPYKFGPPLGHHFVSPHWRDADFRISFAKNKTHSYAVYTICLKNIYGALPMEDKFKEYHVKRDITTATMDFLDAFPVHFGLIDAFVSADGPFGIFADRTPNKTQTVIGGEDLIAVDWIGASKMGLNPMVSPYMEQAVLRFGKPRILLLGQADIYPDWENVTPMFPEMAFGIIDRTYALGNLFYSVFATMDPFFQYRDPAKMRRILRVLNDPIRSIFFERIRQGKWQRKITRKLYELLTLDT